jgi:hypothetical protein
MDDDKRIVWDSQHPLFGWLMLVLVVFAFYVVSDIHDRQTPPVGWDLELNQ